MQESWRMMHNSAIEVSPAQTMAEFQVIEQLQQRVWGSVDLDVVPDHMLLTVAKNGGIVLIARRAGEPVGFAFGFLGKTATGELKICSHQAGVIPTEQNAGVGFALKAAQREAALAQGIGLITWTFDPLQSRNAHFNMRKLGATSRIYLPELYGIMRDTLNAGIPSDRLEARWELDSSEAVRRMAGQSPTPEVLPVQVLNLGEKNGAGFPVSAANPNPLSERRHFIEIPADIAAIKEKNKPLAIEWRMQTRALFQEAFAVGYAITDFVFRAADQRAFYVLER